MNSFCLHPARLGLFLSVVTLLFGQGMGIVFGLNEDLIKSRMKASAEVVRDSIYHGDASAIKAVQDKSWTYMHRAHLHAGAMGTSALAMILLVSLLGTSTRLQQAIGFGLGAGGLGYSVFWMWAGFRAPALGSTSAAKESLKWLAMPSSGAFVVATVVVLGVLIFRQISRPTRGAEGVLWEGATR